MEGDWLTYDEAAERLRTTAEGVRQRAIRKRWPRQIGNDGLARVRPPDGWPDPGRTQAERRKRPVRTQAEPRPDTGAADALRAHVETLKTQLQTAESRIAQQAADVAARDARHVDELAVERDKAEEARAELATLADRLAAILERQSRPWWRRLVG